MEREMDFDPSVGKVIPVDIEKEMKKSFLDYSMSVIVSRALPDVRDGLKPVHRRILYTMWEHNLFPDRPYHKCADTVGNVLGSYHPHGDSSIYDALVRMAQDFSLRYPMVDGHGNFGSVDGDPAAAYRYTEARMSKISMEMLTNINKETVDFGMNYDDRLKEPTVLPSRFPNLLVNGSSGIAVGMATNIPPHNLREVIDGVFMVLENEDVGIAEIMEKIKGPDFPTGGIIMGRSGIRAAYATGKGKITVRARTEIIEAKNGRFKIIVTELPYKVNKARLIENIANLVKDKRIEGISNIEDHSDRKGMHIEIDVKRDASPQIVLNQLFSFTQLQVTFGAIMLAIVDGQPKILTLKDMLKCYVDFQEEVIHRRTQFNLKKAQDRAHILEGLKIAIDFIDEVIAIIRKSKDLPSARTALMERFGLDEVQAQAIVQMRLGQLTNMERTKIEDEIAALHAKIAEYLEILASDSKKLEIVKEELTASRNKYADPRRTEICAIRGEVDIEDLIPVQDCVVTLTHYGYIKRQPADSYKLQKRGGIGISGMKQRDEDFVEELFVGSSHDHILFITDKGLMYRLKCYEIPEGGRSSKGTNIVNLLSLEPDEKITNMICTSDFSDEKYLIFVTKNGLVKRTRLDAYKNLRKKGLIAISLNEGDGLVWTRLTRGQSELIVATKQGMAIRFSEKDVRPSSRQSMGVRAIRLNSGDEVVSMARLREGASVLTISSKGKGRRTSIDEYRLQSRGGSGTKNYKVNDERGYVVGIKVVDDDDDLIMISSYGVIIRIRVSDISKMSRHASGVRVMKLRPGDSVVTVARAEHDSGEEFSDVEKAGEVEEEA